MSVAISQPAALEQDAAQVMQGEFLPGYYEEWAILQQQRFALLRDDLEPIPAVTEPFPSVRNAGFSEASFSALVSVHAWLSNAV